MGVKDIPYNKGYSKTISIKPGDLPINLLPVTTKLNALKGRQKSYSLQCGIHNIQHKYQNMQRIRKI